MKNFEQKNNDQNNRVSFVYKPAETGKMTKITISHNDGGMNYFSGRVEKRCIEIYIEAVDISKIGVSGGYVETSRPMADQNFRYLICDAPRYNKTKMAKIAAVFDERLPELIKAWETNMADGKILLRDISEQAAKSI